jgi:hypothetical protein
LAEELRGALADDRVAKRDRSPLAPGVLVRFQRISSGKSPEGNSVLEVDEDGGLRIARHSGSTGDWRTPMDTSVPSTPTGKAGFGGARKLRKLLAGLDGGDDGEPVLVEGRAAKDGVFEIVTVPPARQFVYDGVDTDLLRALRKLADGAS